MNYFSNLTSATINKCRGLLSYAGNWPVMLILLLIGPYSHAINAQSSGRMVNISGKTLNGADTLLLIKPYEDPRYQGIKFPVKDDSTFNFSFHEESIKEYEIICLNDLKNGVWKTVSFFTDSDDIQFNIQDVNATTKSSVTGSRYTDQRKEYEKYREDKWKAKFLSAMQQASSLSAAEANYKRDSLSRELLLWQFEHLKPYPKAIQLSVFYDDATTYNDNSFLKEDLVKHFKYLEKQFEKSDLLNAIKHKLKTSNNGLINQPFPDFNLIAPGKDSVLLSSQIAKGQFLLIDMWSPWCGPCIKKSKVLKTNYTWLSNNNVKVIGIIGGISSYEKYNNAYEKHKYPWDVYPEISNHQSLWSRYGFENAGGCQVLINQEGIIVAINPSFEEITSMVN